MSLPIYTIYSIQHYVIKFVSDLCQVHDFCGYSSIFLIKTDHHDITETLLKEVFCTITLLHFIYHQSIIPDHWSGCFNRFYLTFFNVFTTPFTMCMHPAYYSENCETICPNKHKFVILVWRDNNNIDTNPQTHSFPVFR